MKRLLILLLVVCCCCNILTAQTTPAKKEGSVQFAVAKLQSLSTDNIIEKAYLHFNKSYYNPGDTIYFKAYVTSGERHELSRISGVLHVDLIGKNDSVMQSLILQLKNGLAWGDFALPAAIPNGYYRVRAYTRWMQNAHNLFVFNKVIPVSGVTSVNNKLADNKVDLQFFPEGGTFVAAVPCKMAFKAVGADGLGVNLKGVIVDDNNTEVTKFSSAHLGMGQLFITPEKDRTYKAKVTYANGTTTVVDLPKPQDKGMSLTIDNRDETKLSIDINANKAYYLNNKDKELSVVVYSGGIIKTAKTVLDNQVIGFDLPKKDLSNGINLITLFSESGTPLSERLVFIQNTVNINFAINSDKVSYQGHDKARIMLNARLPVPDQASVGSFSVAVVNESTVPANEEKEGSILSDMLLTSDLRGEVEQPGYYFNNITAIPATILIF